MMINRREILLGGFACVASARGARASVNPRRLSLRHARTGETFDDVYFVDGNYVPEAANALDHLLRDYTANTAMIMDVRLFDALGALSASINAPLNVTSGYRTPQTNRRLRANGEAAASNSLHVQGMAADVYAPGVSVDRMARAARALALGGVGAYPKRGFIHVDVGVVRRWAR